MARLLERRDTASAFFGRPAMGAAVPFVALALPLAVLALLAPFALIGATVEDPVDPARNLPSLLAMLIPLVAAPVLAVVGGLWSAGMTRDASEAAIGGGVGAFVGTLALFVATGFMFALGVSLARIDIAAAGDGLLRPGLAAGLGYIASGSGILYLLLTTAAGALAGGLAAVVSRRVDLSGATREAGAYREYRA